MGHYFGNELLVVSAVRSLFNAQLGTGVCIGSVHYLVKQFFVAVDPKDFSPSWQTPPLLHATAERYLFQLIL